MEPATPSTTPEKIGAFQLVLLALSLLVLTGLAADTFLALPPEISRILHIVDTAVCSFFFIDFVIRFRAAPSKAAFLKWGWIDLLASIPVIDSLRRGRVVRLLRVLRLLRGLRSLQGLLALVFAHRARGGIASIGLVSFLVVTFSSVGILLCERIPAANIRPAEDAIWWSLTTITTVGYGDKFPVTTAGRIVAASDHGDRRRPLRHTLRSRRVALPRKVRGKDRPGRNRNSHRDPRASCRSRRPPSWPGLSSPWVRTSRKSPAVTTFLTRRGQQPLLFPPSFTRTLSAP